MKVDAFDFHLPDELIAQQAMPRGDSRLLVLGRESGSIAHSAVRALPSWLRPGDLLVANDTRVFPARLLGHRVPSGGAVECLLLTRDPISDVRYPMPEIRSPRSDPRSPVPDPRSPTSDPPSAAAETWQALMHPGQKLKPGAQVMFEGGGRRLHGEVVERLFFGRRRIRLTAERGTVEAAVEALGHMPLPPYIHRPDTDEDRARYQTVFASPRLADARSGQAARGSIAAPTAGLHFDQALVTAIEAAGVERVTITLHVGYGTFKPVRVDEIEAHVVDPEPYEISPAAAAAINCALDQGRRVVAVGTTTTRALEDAARRGDGRVRPGRADAELFIHPGHPGFEFQVISGLMTNFHLPKSSLLMLVAAFAGRERVLAAYQQAVAHRYRFYSYGDAMLVV